mmetsp:Transcript_26464/g.36547  ORF Transcript_26464/g.36547 Transcript_26464/m.36547 type:complete len:287 (-) Transcript_26464:475-1335(-)
MITPAEYVSKSCGLLVAKKTGARKAAKSGGGGLGVVSSTTRSSGGAYSGSSMPCSGLKLIPTRRSVAAPKSINLISPLDVTRILEGLMSRCTIPWECMAESVLSSRRITIFVVSTVSFVTSSKSLDGSTTPERLPGKLPKILASTKSSKVASVSYFQIKNCFPSLNSPELFSAMKLPLYSAQAPAEYLSMMELQYASATPDSPAPRAIVPPFKKSLRTASPSKFTIFKTTRFSFLCFSDMRLESPFGARMAWNTLPKLPCPMRAPTSNWSTVYFLWTSRAAGRIKK